MQNGNNKNSVSMVAQADFVPDVAQVVSPTVIARVFDDKPVPFALNGDGSVKLSVYQDWLNSVGHDALNAFAECSEIVSPKVCGAIVRPIKMRVSA